MLAELYGCRDAPFPPRPPTKNPERASPPGFLLSEMVVETGGYSMSLGTILLIVLIVILLGGFSGLGGGPFYGTGYYGGGGLGIVIIVLLILLLMGRI